MIPKNILDKVDASLISNTANIIYFSKDFGFSEIEREAFLFITKKNNYIISDKRYSSAIKSSKINFQLIDVGVFNFLDKVIDEIIKEEKIKIVGIEENNLTVSEFKNINKKIKTVDTDFTKYKIIKNPTEIKNIKNACRITDQAFNFILKQFKTDITENEISAILENFIKSKNAEISFKSIIAFGKNSAVPHHLSDQTKLKKNQIILLDFGVKFNNYCSDMSRTIFFGKADKKFKEIYKTVLESQNQAIHYINSQSSSMNNQLIANQIDKSARDYIISKNFPSIPHSLGHGIGIEVHEAPNISPNSKQLITDNMIFSIEPGIYLENWGGVRIEDLVLIKNKKAELLYSSNREIIEL